MAPPQQFAIVAQHHNSTRHHLEVPPASVMTDRETATTTDNTVAMERIQKECDVMVRMVKNLQQEEGELAMQCTILAREALICGFDPDVLEPPAPKRRKQTVKKV